MSMIKQQQAHRVLGLASLVLGASILLTACGGDEHHQVKAVDKVDEAAELAKSNAPEPEVLEFEESEVPSAAETSEVDTTEDAESAQEDGAVAEEDTVEVMQEDTATEANVESTANTENTEEVVAE